MSCTPQWRLLLGAGRTQRPAPHCWCGLVQMCHRNQCRRHSPAAFLRFRNFCSAEISMLLYCVWWCTFIPCMPPSFSAHFKHAAQRWPSLTTKLKHHANCVVHGSSVGDGLLSTSRRVMACCDALSAVYIPVPHLCTGQPSINAA